MNTKQYIKRVMEENNKELIKYFQSTLTQSINNLKTYIDTELENISDRIYTKEEMQALIYQMIEDYTMQQATNLFTVDNKYIVTSDNKLFEGKDS